MITQRSKYAEADSDDESKSSEDDSDNQCEYYLNPFKKNSCAHRIAAKVISAISTGSSNCVIAFNKKQLPHILSLLYFMLFFLAARKRKKSNHDRTWKFEEKRGSRDHRRGGGFSNSRNRYRNSDDSDEDSPPLRLNDGENFLGLH